MGYKKSLSIWVTISLVLVLLTLAFLAGCQPTPPPAKAPAAPTTPAPAPKSTTPIKIGFTNALTGIYSSMGVVETQGRQAWVKKMNKAGGILGHPIQAVFYDSESTSDKGILNVKKMIQDDKVHLVCGDSSTGISIPESMACAQLKTPFSAQSGSSAFEANMKQAGPDIAKWAFRTTQASDQERLAWIFQYYKQLGVKKVAVVFSEDGMGKATGDMAKAYIARSPEFGLEVVMDQTFPADAVTFGPLISGLKAKPEIQGIITGGAAMATALSIVAINEAGINVPICADAAIIVPQNMSVEKVKQGLMRAKLIVSNDPLAIWRELPDNNPTKGFCRNEYNFWKEEVGVEANFGVQYTTCFEQMMILEDIFTRLLKDKPDILDKDLDTARATVRDYYESIKDLPLWGMVTMSPTDHVGYKWGTSFRIGQMGPDGNFHYVPVEPPPAEKY